MYPNASLITYARAPDEMRFDGSPTCLAILLGLVRGSSVRLYQGALSRQGARYHSWFADSFCLRGVWLQCLGSAPLLASDLSASFCRRRPGGSAGTRRPRPRGEGPAQCGKVPPRKDNPGSGSVDPAPRRESPVQDPQTTPRTRRPFLKRSDSAPVTQAPPSSLSPAPAQGPRPERIGPAFRSCRVCAVADIIGAGRAPGPSRSLGLRAPPTPGHGVIGAEAATAERLQLAVLRLPACAARGSAPRLASAVR